MWRGMKRGMDWARIQTKTTMDRQKQIMRSRVRPTQFEWKALPTIPFLKAVGVCPQRERHYVAE